jgi:hypothetical protein
VRLRRAGLVVGGLVVAWFAALLLLDGVLGARQQQNAIDRLGESLQAVVSVGGTDLALVSGRLDLERLAVHRDDAVGHLAIDVADVRCELPPLGWALVDSQCRELRVTGTRLEVSSSAVFHIKNPKRPPISVQRVVIDDAVLAFAPSAFVPNLGQIEIRIDHAESHATTFRTPLSWLLALDTLDARIDLPGNFTVRLGYHDSKLSAAGTLFGASPVEVPIELPAAERAHDAHEEVQLLVETGKDLAERLVAKRAEDWLRAKLFR